LKAKAAEVEKLLPAGVNPTELALMLGIGRSSRAMSERQIGRVAGVAPAEPIAAHSYVAGSDPVFVG
jgi:hypothetical protein